MHLGIFLQEAVWAEVEPVDRALDVNEETETRSDGDDSTLETNGSGRDRLELQGGGDASSLGTLEATKIGQLQGSESWRRDERAPAGGGACKAHRRRGTGGSGGDPDLLRARTHPGRSPCYPQALIGASPAAALRVLKGGGGLVAAAEVAAHRSRQQ